MVELVEMGLPELAARIAHMRDDYAAQMAASGEPAESAQARADASMNQLIPGGRPAEGQHVMGVVHAGETVGLLWMGRRPGDPTGSWYVFDVEIDPPHRGRGYGRAAMLTAEDWVRAQGGDRIGLNVFAPNAAARSLYESLDYRLQALAMFKEL